MATKQPTRRVLGSKGHRGRLRSHGINEKSKAAGLQQDSHTAGVLVSITDLSHAFTMARETIKRRLADSAVPAVGQRGGHPTYSLRDSVQAIMNGDSDPARLDPFRKKALLQSEQIATKLAEDRGELLQIDDVRETFAGAFRVVQLTLETLPDLLERDAALTPQQTEVCERALDNLRQDLHAKLMEVANARARG